MKTKLCVAGIGGCMLLIFYCKPYVLFSSNPSEQSQKDITKVKGLLNYEKSNIPGLEVKTPAKVAIVNKLAVAKMKNAPKSEKAIAAKNSPDKDWLASLKKESKPEKKSAVQQEENSSATDDVAMNDSYDELDKKESDINPYVAESDVAGSNKPLVNMPKPKSANENTGRTVINYGTNSYVENTSVKKFPHDEEATHEEATVVKEESVHHMAVAEKSEKTYAFRGKTAVKSSLYKYIPPFWDGFSEETGASHADYNLLMSKARNLAKLAAKDGYNTEFAFLLDMSVKSNRNRFFVVNLRTMSIEMSSLVAQGRGKERLNLDKDYSNRPGSNCSSLGLYKIAGKSYDGDFGRSYRLFGMDATNKNAFQRSIVLHAMGSIPNVETNFPIWQSEGCPSVSTLMLEKLGDKIEASKKPVLMLMYDDTYIPMNGKVTGTETASAGN